MVDIVEVIGIIFGINPTPDKLAFRRSLNGSNGRICLQWGRPGLKRSPGEGNGNLLQYSCLENLMDRGPDGLESMRLQKVGDIWATNTFTLINCKVIDSSKHNLNYSLSHRLLLQENLLYSALTLEFYMSDIS